MIVPMKKVSLIILENNKTETLKKLRKLGLVHIEMTESIGEKISELKEQVSLVESAVFHIGKNKTASTKNTTLKETLSVAEAIVSLGEEKKAYQAELVALNSELERLKSWGDIDPDEIYSLSEKGVDISFYEMPYDEYKNLGDKIKTLCLYKTKSTIKFLIAKSGIEGEEEIIDSLESYKLKLPKASTEKIKQKIDNLTDQIKTADEKTASYACYIDSMKKAISDLEKEIEFETYSAGMAKEKLTESKEKDISVVYFKGYIEASKLDSLKKAAKDNCWGLLSKDPDEDDNVPTKLENNKFVSLIYPLTDFLGTVPGYFEYDISAWFLSFILIFFGIIFGDGGYGLLILFVAAVPILKAIASKKEISPAFLLIGLFGISTVLWGTLTCTWFGLSVDKIPIWLKSLSVPVISNVYADKIWYPFWTMGKAGLTTAQNLQILCFSLALIQLTIAHIKGIVRYRKTFRFLGDVGAILQLTGIYYVVLSLVVNSDVFSFGLIIGGVGVGTVSVGLIAIGFLMSFIFSNYEGSIIKSILSSLTNIVSVLLGVVNVFSDIVSYIRLWAVGLAGAAISATVNELAGPLLGNFMFMILAIVLLVFGHGLNMILNILSVIVHGIRLNTLEFSSHLDMSWSGHKFKPFKE